MTILIEEKATIDKYIGDAVMYFGACLKRYRYILVSSAVYGLIKNEFIFAIMIQCCIVF